MSAHGAGPAWQTFSDGIRRSITIGFIPLNLECEIRVNENDITPDNIISILLNCDTVANGNDILESVTTISLSALVVTV